MLSHLKAREAANSDKEATAEAPTAREPAAAVTAEEQEKEDTRATCDVLCSLGAAASYSPEHSSNDYGDDDCSYGERPRKHKACPKQHQLPMFLSSKLNLYRRGMIFYVRRDGGRYGWSHGCPGSEFFRRFLALRSVMVNGPYFVMEFGMFGLTRLQQISFSQAPRATFDSKSIVRWFLSS